MQITKPSDTFVECTREELKIRVVVLWSSIFLDHESGTKNKLLPFIDSGWPLGFSIRLFGPPYQDESYVARAYAALELLLCVLEDEGHLVARDGYNGHDERLVLGWAVAPNGVQYRHLGANGPARRERADRLSNERAERAQ